MDIFIEVSDTNDDKMIKFERSYHNTILKVLGNHI